MVVIWANLLCCGNSSVVNSALDSEANRCLWVRFLAVHMVHMVSNKCFCRLFTFPENLKFSFSFVSDNLDNFPFVLC